MTPRLLYNCAMLTEQGQQKSGQALLLDDELIIWSGDLKALPADLEATCHCREDCAGQLLTPGLIDCHTHLVYAGNRAHEFRMRLEGLSYADIARQGGGILSTVAKTRAASTEELITESLPRLRALTAQGVTTVEIKSGYGLDLAAELKMLRVAKELGKITGIRICTTFLGAHAVPPEFSGQKQAYVDYLCNEMLPAVTAENLADAVDVFCEHLAFDLAQTEQIFTAAQELGLPIKCHADQLSNLGASALAASFNALSCDHLEFIDEKSAHIMGINDIIAVLLPGAFYFLNEKKAPPVHLLRQNAVKMAVATDANPGSSPTASLLLMMSMACRFFGLTVPEVLQGVTVNAAQALGLAAKVGRLAPGFYADIVKWPVRDCAELCYYFGYPLPHETMIAGKWVKKGEG